MKKLLLALISLCAIVPVQANSSFVNKTGRTVYIDNRSGASNVKQTCQNGQTCFTVGNGSFSVYASLDSLADAQKHNSSTTRNTIQITSPSWGNYGYIDGNWMGPKWTHAIHARKKSSFDLIAMTHSSSSSHTSSKTYYNNPYKVSSQPAKTGGILKIQNTVSQPLYVRSANGNAVLRKGQSTNVKTESGKSITCSYHSDMIQPLTIWHEEEGEGFFIGAYDKRTRKQIQQTVANIGLRGGTITVSGMKDTVYKTTTTTTDTPYQIRFQ